MRHSKLLAICLFLFSAIAASAQGNSGICHVSAYWWDKEHKLGSGLMLLGQFNPVVADERTVKTFKAIDSGLIVTAGVEYPRDYGKSRPAPLGVNLAITVSNKEGENIFGSVMSSEASTKFRKGWNLSAGKNIEFENKIYTFGLSCSDTLKTGK